MTSSLARMYSHIRSYETFQKYVDNQHPRVAVNVSIGGSSISADKDSKSNEAKAETKSKEKPESKEPTALDEVHKETIRNTFPDAEFVERKDRTFAKDLPFHT